MRRLVRVILPAAALALVTPLAHAADEGAVKDAQSRFEEGLARARTGDFDAARISFTQAYAVLRRPRILWNLALSEEKTGHVLEALGHFKSVAGDPTADEDDRSGAQTHVAALYGQTGHIEVRAPAGAPIRIDSGPILGVAPLADVVDVTPGRHVVEARLVQGQSAVVVEPAAGEVSVATFVQPASAGVGAGTGGDSGGNPGAGAAAGAGAAGTAAPGAGATASAPVGAGVGAGAATTGNGGEGLRGDSDLATRGTARSSNQTARIVVAGSAAGVAVGALVLGIYFGAKSTSEASTANGLRGQVGTSGCIAPMGSLVGTCGQLSDAVSAQNRDAGLSTGMYIAAGVIAAAGVVTWFVWPRSEHAKRAAARIGPVLGPGLAGVSAQITF